MSTMSIIHLHAVIALCILIVYAQNSPRVTISNGTLEGTIMQSRKGRDFFAFRGIPYARPPLGELRFQQPQSPISWTGVRSAKADGADCLQKNYTDPAMRIIGSEDCLFINVYTPKSLNLSCESYPVMVWIHGGSFIFGSGASTLYGPNYLMDRDIIFVALNYRLGSLGFLSTGDSIVPGNQAMKDQVQALRWVQENIRAFGGNPNKVTIAGESAGAFSVNYLMLSPLAAGLFHQAICESGAAISAFLFNTAEMAKSSAERLGRELNCPTGTSEDLLRCLLSKDARDVASPALNWAMVDGFPIAPFAPVVEANVSGAFLTEEPGILVESGQFADVPWVNGLNSDEGSLGAVPLYMSPNQTELKRFNDEFVELAPRYLGYNFGCSKASQDEASRKIREYYFGNQSMDESTKQNVIDMYSDGLFNVGTALAVKAHFHTKTSPVYFYEFIYRGTLSYTSVLGDPDRDYGVGHADELLYLFPENEEFFGNRRMSERDLQMVDIMTTLWTNFVINGEPLPTTTAMLPVAWRPVTSDALENFVIGGPGNFTMSKDAYTDTLDFWSQLPCRAGLSSSSKLADM